MIENFKLQPTDHCLEIGCGWGSFSIRAASKIGCKVTALTLSVEQKKLFEKRVHDAGLEHKIAVLLCDYRSLPTPEVPYDKIVSIEALECCSPEELDVYYRCVDDLLKKDGGICSVQVTFTPEIRYADQFPKGEGFIPKYIFPGGHAPSVSRVIEAIQKGGQNHFDVDAVINYGPHYAKTLRLWREAFESNFDSKIAPALGKECPRLNEDELEVFRKKYIYYFTYTEAGFAMKILHSVHITVSRQMTMVSIAQGEEALF